LVRSVNSYWELWFRYRQRRRLVVDPGILTYPTLTKDLDGIADGQVLLISPTSIVLARTGAILWIRIVPASQIGERLEES